VHPASRDGGLIRKMKANKEKTEAGQEEMKAAVEAGQG
jgi:hypothetical protein